MKTVSYREFSRLVGVSDTAIRKAIKSGRFKDFDGKTPDGKPCIVNVNRAIEVWVAHAANRGLRTRQSAGSQSPPDSKQPNAAADTPDVETPPVESSVISAKTLIEAQRLATLERAKKLRLENDLTRGRLVEVGKVAKEAFEAQRTLREAILNIPSRLSAELAAESDAARVYLRLEAALREALNETADTLLATANG